MHVCLDADDSIRRLRTVMLRWSGCELGELHAVGTDKPKLLSDLAARNTYTIRVPTTAVARLFMVGGWGHSIYSCPDVGCARFGCITKILCFLLHNNLAFLLLSKRNYILILISFLIWNKQIELEYIDNNCKIYLTKHVP